MKRLILATILSCSLSGFAQEIVKGVVFEDSNNNGKKEGREQGIPEVAVSNGVQVVLTDAQGRYELPVGTDNIISVIKPANFKFGVDDNNLPQFYYIHKPQGSPKTEFPGVAPSGKLPRSLDFALLPSEEKKEFGVLVFGDPQPYNLQEIDYFARGIVAKVEAGEEVLFGLSLGDLVGDNLDLFNPYIKAVKEVGLPWYNLLGNHDINFDATTDALSDETYEAHFGPANYAFNYGDVHFIVLDDVIYPDPRDGKGYIGGLREDQLEFVKNNLQYVPKDKLVVLAYHIPMKERGQNVFRDEDREALFYLLREYPYTFSLSAHTHIQRQDFFGKEDGWLREDPHHEYNVGTTSGDWYSGVLDEEGLPISTMRDGTPKGYAFLNFNGNQYKVSYQAAGKPKDYQMEVFAPKVVAQGRNTQASIYANFFMGAEGDEVLYRINSGEWKPMIYVREHDPSYAKLVNEWDQLEELVLGRRSSNPIISDHLWRGRIPAKEQAGEYKVEIKATDMYGQTFTAETSYRLEEPVKN